MTDTNSELEKILNSVWDDGYQCHKAIILKGNQRINERDFRLTSADKAKAAINQLLLKAWREKLQATLEMNGTHEGDWKEAIKQRIAELDTQIQEGTE